MKVYYNQKTDLLYIRLDDRQQQVENERLRFPVNQYTVANIGENDKVIGLEIMDASKNLDLPSALDAFLQNDEAEVSEHDAMKQAILSRKNPGLAKYLEWK